MKLRLYRDVVNQIYKVTVVTEDWSQDDLKLMTQYGEPEVNLGATLEATPTGGGTAEVFVVPDCYVRLISDSHKLNISFDLRDHALAKEMAQAWQVYIVDTITGAVTQLRTNTPDTYEEVTSI